MRKGIVELASSGVDEWLTAVGGDPFGASTATGLRVPTLATPDTNHRYLFIGASFSLGEGATAKIHGYRQLVTIGAVTTAPSTESPGRFVEMEVTSPLFRLPDGNVSFHLHRLGAPNARGWPLQPPSNNTDLRNFVRRWADGPTLLYESYTIPAGNAFYVNVTGYTPPNRGQPWGEPLGQLNVVRDLRTEWMTHGAWHALDNVIVEGPSTTAMFISVRQSAGASGTGVTPLPDCMCEEQFLSSFGGLPGGVIYWRVGCALAVEFL
jgi:hypothetical protein